MDDKNSADHWDPVRKLRIRVNGDHCILCLRQVTSGKTHRSSIPTSESASEQLLIVTKAAAAVPEGFLSTLNLVWPCIIQKKGGGGGVSVRDVLEGKPNECSESLSERSREVVQFSRLPTLCQYCADKVNQVETLMKAVRSQVEVVRNIILESKRGGVYSWRVDQFERDLGKDLECEEEDVPSTSFECSEIQVVETGSQPTTFQESAVTGTSAGTEPSAVVVSVNSFNELGLLSADNDQDSFPSSISVKEEDSISFSGEDGALCESSVTEFEPEDQSDPEDEYEPFDDKDDPDYIKSECDEDDDMDDNSGGDESMEDEDEVETPISTDWSPNTEKDPLSDTILNRREKAKQSTKRKPTNSSKEAKLWAAYYGSHKPFKCTVSGCLWAFNAKGALTAHLKKQHPEDHAPILCPCGERFVSEIHRRRHLFNHPKRKGDKILKREDLQTCDMCGASVDLTEILEHVRSHVGNFAVKCPNPSCSYAFTNSTALQTHLSWRKKVCWKFALDKGNEKIIFPCENCDFKTDHRLGLRHHMKQIHERAKEKPFACPISGCGEKFAVRQSVDFHLATHNFKPITTQRCDQCSEIFKLDEIITHMKTKHDVNEPLKCQQCPLVFSTRIPLIKHVFVHRFNGLMCDICDDNVKYLRYHELCKHYSTEHQINIDFLRQDKPSRSRIKREDKPQSDSHDREQTLSKTPKRYSCDVCYESVSFPTQSGLASHKIRIHGEEPYTCGSCDKTFTHSFALRRHEKEHAGMKFQTEFKCEMNNCGKVFDSKKKWTYHLIHSHGESDGRRHVCEECGKSYVTPKELQRHRDAVHLGLRPFICDTCGESFASSTSIKRHTLIHTGDRPFSCDICGQRFRYRDVLKRHIQAHKEKGDNFKPNGPMKQIRKRVKRD